MPLILAEFVTDLKDALNWFLRYDAKQTMDLIWSNAHELLDPTGLIPPSTLPHSTLYLLPMMRSILFSLNGYCNHETKTAPRLPSARQGSGLNRVAMRSGALIP